MTGCHAPNGTPLKGTPLKGTSLGSLELPGRSSRERGGSSRELGRKVRVRKAGGGGHRETPKGSLSQAPRAQTVRRRERGRVEGRGGEGGGREEGRPRRRREREKQ